MLAPTIVVGGITTWLRLLQKYSNYEAVDYKVIDTSKLYETFDSKFSARSALFGIRNATLRLYKLLRAVVSEKPDLVYFACAPSFRFAYRDTLYLFLMKILKIPSVVHMHGGNIEDFFEGNALKRYLVINSLRTSLLILVITRDMESYSRDIFGNKVTYMPNMFDDEMFKDIANSERLTKINNGHEFIALHVAWQSKEKGTIDLIKAMGYTKHKVKCFLVGTYAAEFKSYADKLIYDMDLKNKVIFVGEKTGEDLQRFYSDADLFVFPTHHEGFPMVILEGMAFGLPIIANDVGNIREMIGVDDEHPAGILLKQVSPVDPIELAGLIDELVKDHERRRQMGAAGKQRIEDKYLASKVVPVLENYLWNMHFSGGSQANDE